MFLSSIQITLKLSWKKARKYIKDDIRYKNFADSDYVSKYTTYYQ